MTSTGQHRISISGIRRRAASAAMALAVVLLPAVVAIPTAQAQTFSVLHTFNGAPDGYFPVAGLVADAAGNLYGTTSEGGVIGGSCGNFYGCGVVFKLDTSGAESVLYSFTGGADGGNPKADLVLDAAGNLYGTTSAGGASNLGTVFKLDTSGTETVLHSFTGSPDGATPVAGLVMDGAGNLYGTTFEGGTIGGACGDTRGCGVVFKLDTSGSGTETVLYSFTGGTDGANPAADLVLDAAGNLYGTAATLFKLDPTGKETVLPAGSSKGVIRDAAGNFYGITLSSSARETYHDLDCAQGGEACGSVWELNAAGVYTTLYDFEGGDYLGPDGAFPQAGLVRDGSGNLYGTTYAGGVGACRNGQTGTGCGTVFKVDASGHETVLHRFVQTDGAFPQASLIQDPAGNLYGTTSGNVFKLAGPFATLSLSASAFTPTTVSPGGSSTSTVTAAGFSGPVNLEVSGLPAGATGTFNPAMVTGSGSSTLTVQTSSSTPIGTSQLTITGTSGSQLQTTEQGLEVAVPDFVITTTTSTQTVTPGGTASYTVNVGSLYGFSGSVALTCSVQPTPALAPQCSISPSPTNAATNATLTVSTTPPTAGALPSSGGSGLFYAVWLPLMGLAVTGVGFGSGQRKGKIPAIVLSCVLFAGLVFTVACGGSSSSGGGSSGTPAGAYTITVTGTAPGSPQHSTTAMLTVQ